ncbi:hypothetical protein R69658_08174 [Paraburkholderia aspalathi]|uniref:Uncharacterized protein n=1 Tax=Paraburkholderia aspalathi TaxID=1324617 RepID=A0ABN7NHR6_9BURK|nr:hypothetical protein R75465_06702 [Paraburkholderia aspalathi]CAE6869113.1 hypothetical protein R69746_08292 [Paraburkholderia aspalathi]CAE6871413.1 hypothetical protein R69658_08174 [Paraburkholderia aspalathi]
MGTPSASTRMWCLESGRERSVGFGPVFRSHQELVSTRNLRQHIKSICPLSRNLSSNSSRSRSRTPVLRQSFSRRRQVAPEPKPNTVGRWVHRGPVLNANRMPFNGTRSNTRGRPGCSLRRGLGGGSHGSISVHNSSSMIGASIPWSSLFRYPGLTACRESKQPLQSLLNWPLRYNAFSRASANTLLTPRPI